MRQLILPVLLAMLSCDSKMPPEPDWGIECVFKVHPPTEDEKAQGGIPRGLKLIKKRLSLAGFRYSQVVHNGDEVKIRIPGVDASNIYEAGSAIKGGGMLRIYQAADAKAHTAYHQTRIIPEGHRAIWCRESDPSWGGVEVDPWSAPFLVLKNEEIFGERDIRDAWPEPDREGSHKTKWLAVFELTKEAAQRLDAAVAEVSRMRPPGVLVILVDENPILTFKPTGPIHREARITGLASEQEARNLARLSLGGGFNPVCRHTDMIGREYKAPPIVTYYGTPKSSGK